MGGRGENSPAPSTRQQIDSLYERQNGRRREPGEIQKWGNSGSKQCPPHDHKLTEFKKKRMENLYWSFTLSHLWLPSSLRLVFFCFSVFFFQSSLAVFFHYAFFKFMSRFIISLLPPPPSFLPSGSSVLKSALISLFIPLVCIDSIGANVVARMEEKRAVLNRSLYSRTRRVGGIAGALHHAYST